eukprot:7329738-Pyramimonas_sp.AAC.1
MRPLKLGGNCWIALALGLGKCAAYAPLICCRREAALSVDSGSKPEHRWIPSELNAADGGSRRWGPRSS